MPDRTLDNYPDILGYITGGKRANISVIQVASALKPRVVLAGRPLEMLLLVQNAANQPVQVTATLRLPEYDAKKQKGRFVTKAERLVIRLEPANVGLLTLPLSTLPDTAAGADYKIGMEVKVAPLSHDKPVRIRHPEGGGVVDEQLLPETSRELIQSLKDKPWTVDVSGSTITSKLTVMSGKVGAFADLTPSWTTLWSLADYMDETFLLHHWAHVLRDKVLPALTRPNILPVIQEYTAKRFENVGYTLQEEELRTIVRLLTLMLEYANPRERDMMFLLGEAYNIKKYVEKDKRATQAEGSEAVKLPRWCLAFLRQCNKDERIAQYPVKAIAHFAFDALLEDAMLHSFDRVHNLLGLDLGTLEEQQLYIQQVFEAMNAKQLTFDLLYMPLVLGGIAIADGVHLTKDEKAQGIITALRPMLEYRLREAQKDEHAQEVYKMATQLLDLSASKYNFSEW